MTRKIAPAPTLAWFLSAYGEDGDPRREQAERELRALTAVAKAAQRASLGMFTDEAEVWHLSKDATPAINELRRALSRLSPGSRTAGRSRR